MTKKERAAAVTELLKTVYPEAVCALHYTHDYELLFATRLSAQCTDARVNIVTEKLFKQFPTLQSFADASEEEIAEAHQDLRPVPHQSARPQGVRHDADCQLRRQGAGYYGGAAQAAGCRPQDRQPHPRGYFRQTGHCVRYALASVCPTRAGFVKNEKDPVKVENALRKLLDPAESSDFCHRLVLVRPRALHRPQSEVRGLSARRGVPVVSHCEIT